MSLIGIAGNRVTDVKQYLKEASADNSIKYRAEKGAKHLIYVPTVSVDVMDEATGTKVTKQQIVAVSQKVHDWNDNEGKYRTTICLDGIIRKGENGEIINDGTCPICERVSDAWDIYNSRKEKLEAETNIPDPKAREEYIKKILESYRDAMKAKEARDYIYLLIAFFETKGTNMEVVYDEDTKLPKYSLKVMKIAATRLEKINKSIQNSGVSIEGAELIFEYKDTDDIRQQVGESTVSIVMESNRLTNNEALLNAINTDVAKFDFETIDTAFREWKGMSTEEATIKMRAQFRRWDEYKEALKTNPNAMYLEYVQAMGSAQPQVGNMGAQAFNGVSVPQVGIPQAGVQMPSMMGQTPNMMGQANNVMGQVPQAGVMQANSAFPQGVPVVDGRQEEATQAGNNSVSVQFPDPNVAFAGAVGGLTI